MQDRLIIPDAASRKALFIIDVQPATFKSELPLLITKQIVRFIEKVPYDAYVIAEYHAPPQAMFGKENDYVLAEQETGQTCDSVVKAVAPYQDVLLRIRKTNRSCFKGTDALALQDFLAQKEIEEIHFTGFDINDCVLASAFEAIDSGFYSFILEELCHHNSGIETLKDAALTIFHRQNMTNHSLKDKINRKVIDLKG